ncbi:MAG: ribulose-phosphate 3-epimerase [Patescibacteria group bacterium]|jgi:ribulose-phosphate 3-epimerase
MATIVPTILTDDINDLNRKLSDLSGLVEWAQIDLMDGVFVNTLSVKPEELKDIVTDLRLEVHLMVKDPRAWLPYLPKEKFERIIFHFEAVPEPEGLIEELKEANYQVGMAVNLETPIEALEPFIDLVDLVLFLAIVPGRQGQPFHQEVAVKVEQMRDMDTRTLIGVDGGINEQTIGPLVSAGVDWFCVGSALFKSGSISENISTLQEQLI